ncbi:uncharacterized protein LOC142983899 [Anticarsia gemmatalis]|uniref:uncharacterized protein LOC142983899 n=1 Tax=Anticarsia gemmatalis TaxID=129554 RepID=UPI003F75C96D
MYMKKCTVEEIPEPPPPDPCKLQRIRLKEKAGIKICPPKPVRKPTPAPTCHALCIERVKNPPIVLDKFDHPIICVVEREVTTTDRCDEIELKTLARQDPPWPGCPQPPEPPPPPIRDPCEEQDRRERLARCKERMKRYFD